MSRKPHSPQAYPFLAFHQYVRHGRRVQYSRRHFFPLMGRGTHRTNPLPFGQPQLLIDIPTDVAAFRRREETFNLVKFCPVPAAFVSELQEQLSPAAVGDPFGQMVIGQHSLHMQVFGIEDLVLVHHPFQEDNPSLTQRPPFIRLFKEAIFCRFLL
jgi:hypothetical protein